MSTTDTINGEVYVKQSYAGPPPETLIVVVEGRWNLVGRCVYDDAGNLTITDASVIRYWGTTKGLGELAAGGPTSKTILDPAGTVRIPAGKVLLTLDATAEVWAK